MWSHVERTDMEQQSPLAGPVSVVVRRPMNSHGTMTVETAQSNEVRHFVEYASDRVRSVLEGLPAGTVIPVQMTRVGGRSNVWRVSDIPSTSVRTPPNVVG